MSRVVPSQVVDYLDSRFPLAQAIDPARQRWQLSQADAPAVAQVVAMVEAIPDRLLIMPPDEYAIFGEATSALRFAVTRWLTDKNYQLEHLASRNRQNPLQVLRGQLVVLPDEGVAEVTNELLFLRDDALRELLRRDLSSVEFSLSNGEWKAATVLAGSVVEALLLNVVNEQAEAAEEDVSSAIERAVGSGALRREPAGDKDQWGLHELTEVCGELRVIEPNTAIQCRLARGFRNLIHPGKAVRVGQVCDRATALSAVAAVEHVVRDLSA